MLSLASAPATLARWTLLACLPSWKVCGAELSRGGGLGRRSTRGRQAESGGAHTCNRCTGEAGPGIQPPICKLDFSRIPRPMAPSQTWAAFLEKQYSFISSFALIMKIDFLMPQIYIHQLMHTHSRNAEVCAAMGWGVGDGQASQPQSCPRPGPGRQLATLNAAGILGRAGASGGHTERDSVDGVVSIPGGPRRGLCSLGEGGTCPAGAPTSQDGPQVPKC